MNMAKQKNIFDPENVLPKIQDFKNRLWNIILSRKKLVASLVIVVIGIFLLSQPYRRKVENTNIPVSKSITATIAKSFDFPAFNNQGKPSGGKMKFTITNAEKTNQVMVNDKVIPAKNDKLFLILNIELKNDATTSNNIFPGDLIRLAYNTDEENKFAPDLHNNFVSVAALSTKLDRVGFVVPNNAKNFKIYVGELEGKKEAVVVGFPS